MNSNKALIFFSCFLFVLVVVSALNHSGNNRYEYISTDNELLMSNIHFIPDIVRSYEKVKIDYGRKNTLIIRYANNLCDNCFDSLLDELLSFQEEIGKDFICIFPAYPNDRRSRIRLSNDLAKFNYQNIPADSLLIPICGEEEKSYFAWINNKGDIEMVFFPDRNRFQHTRRYFQEVKKLLLAVEE